VVASHVTQRPFSFPFDFLEALILSLLPGFDFFPLTVDG
jgi:hypothetical protein